MYGNRLDRASISSKVWRFGRLDGGVIADIVRLNEDGSIQGHVNDNESAWAIADDVLVFIDSSGVISTKFEILKLKDNLMFAPIISVEGRFRQSETIHTLTEVDRLGQKINETADIFVDRFAKDVLGRNHDCFDVTKIAALSAAYDSAKYFASKMRMARVFDKKEDLLRYAVSLMSIRGLCMEFGVASGYTINLIASMLDQKVYGFDTFEGLPEDWRPGFEAGMFAQHIPSVGVNVELIAGLFEATFPTFKPQHPGPAAFLHVDCDLYSSTKTIFNTFGDVIVPGTVIVFDEYFNFPGWEYDEFKAFQEFVAARGCSYSYVGLVKNHQQVCVVIR